MRAGTTVAGRFLIEREAGAGGMGRVYRARDAATGRTVALKVLIAEGTDERDRFEREARILSALSHPSIVAYVAHGDDLGQPFIAMEWLEGQSLSARLRKGPLAVESATELGVRVADALACAHEAGVLHRDVKPGNLILDGEDTNVRVVDFGVARRTREAKAVTRTGMIVGSCAYMSPEQALAQRDVDARSDLFSLGCVLYECLSGVRAFGARDATAALAKVLLDEPAPVREIAPHVPRALADIVTRLLRKDRTERPPNARVVAERLRAARDAGDEVEAPAPPALGTREKRVVWVVLASGFTLDAAEESRTLADDAPTQAEDSAGSNRLRAIVKSFGGTLAFLADGAAIATFSGGVPTDEAPRAARCALAMHEALPAAPIAIAMGRGESHQASVGVPIGEVIDDAADALRRTPPGAIRLRGVEPEWLAGFSVAPDEHGIRLVARTETTLAPRTLLGRPTACVGRERELSMLEGLFDDAASESQPKVALVTAAAGAGKSRIRYELVSRLEARAEPPVVLVARCDPMSAGAPFAALGDAIRREAGITSDGDEDTQRRQIEGCVRKGGTFDRATQAALLGEMCGVHFPDEASEVLHAARRDARLMGDSLRTAFEEWIASFAHPVVLVIEDLHWGDVPSVRVLDSVLRNLSSRALFVLALARPEVSELFPSVWSERGIVAIALSPLSKRAAEQLVRDALGDRAQDDAVHSLVARAQGNAFFLEELIRGIARGDGALPDSIFGVLQARLDELHADARRILRAASIFGDSFTVDQAFALLSGMTREIVDFRLLTLARAEIVTQGSGAEFRFRHALVRDAAYATLTDDDRKLGHKLAGELLEASGGAGPLALAEHFVRGGVPERAIAHLRASAIKALEGNDLRGAVALAERALALNPPQTDLGSLHATMAEACRWIGEYDRASTHGLAAIDALDEGTTRWFFAVGEFLATCAYRRDFESASPRLAAVRRAHATSPEARNAQIICTARGGTQLLEGGLYDEADEIARELRAEPDENLDDNARGWMHWLFAMRALRDGDLATFATNTETTLAAFERIGEIRNTSSQRINLGYAYAELGAFERAEPLLRRVQQDAERVGLPMVVAYALQNLGNVLRSLGRLQEAREQERRATAIGESIGDKRIEGASRAYGALMTLELGDVSLAESQCRAAIVSLEKNPPLVGFAKAVLARALLSRGRTDEALEASREAMAIVESGVEDGETFIRLARIDMLEACGDLDAARALAIESEGRLLTRAARIHDDALRTSFLERVPESAKTLAAAARLRG
jgi:tetratricopeptide (TPR) repeat protein/predicted Ser/Thr protein kinase